MSNEQTTWEFIMRMAVDKIDSFPVATPGWTAAREAMNELQKVYTAKFGRKFSYGTISD